MSIQLSRTVIEHRYQELDLGSQLLHYLAIDQSV